jgi:hypothetical protein
LPSSEPLLVNAPSVERLPAPKGQLQRDARWGIRKACRVPGFFHAEVSSPCVMNVTVTSFCARSERLLQVFHALLAAHDDACVMIKHVQLQSGPEEYTDLPEAAPSCAPHAAMLSTCAQWQGTCLCPHGSACAFAHFSLLLGALCRVGANAGRRCKGQHHLRYVCIAPTSCFCVLMAMHPHPHSQRAEEPREASLVHARLQQITVALSSSSRQEL